MDSDPTRKIVAFPAQLAAMPPGRRYVLRAPSTVRINPLPRPVQTRLPLRRVAQNEPPTIDQRINYKKATVANYQDLLAKATTRQDRERLQRRIAQHDAELEALLAEKREHREQAELLLPMERSVAS